MIDLGLLAEFDEESVRIVTVGSREIGVIRWHGEQVYALHNRCPHMAAPLCRGALGPRLDGQPGLVSVSDAPVIACPWHHWEFDVRTGRSLGEGTSRVRCYPVAVEGGRVLIDLSPRH